MNKHLVIGASGLVGAHLLSRLIELGQSVTGTYYLDLCPGLLPLDIRDKKAVNTMFREIHPEIVYLPAAITNVEYCQKYPEETYLTNVQGTVNVVRAANEIDAKIIFFSSDYVFDGMQGPYSEDDPTRPISEYGNQKLIGEHYIAFHSKNYLIIRTTVVYGWESQGKNFVQRLIKSLRGGECIRVPVDQIGNPTFAPNLADAVIELATGRETGLCNIVGSTLVNRYEFAVATAKAFDLDPLLIVSVSTEELGQVAQRPLSAGLRVDKARKILRTSLLGYLEGLKMMAAMGKDL